MKVRFSTVATRGFLFLPARRFDQCFASQISKWKKIILKESLWDQGKHFGKTRNIIPSSSAKIDNEHSAADPNACALCYFPGYSGMRHRNQLTVKAWEETVQELGNRFLTSATSHQKPLHMRTDCEAPIQTSG